MEQEGEVTRRELLIGAASGLALAAIEPLQAEAQTSPGQVSGTVFEDRDGSGALGASNPGLAGVLVSNGRDVAVTGPDGRYTLPLPEEATIFVVKPAGFMPPVEPLTNLPRFYRHHQPKVRRRTQPDLRRPRADRPVAGVGRFPAAPAGGARGVQRRHGQRPAARDRRRGRLHP